MPRARVREASEQCTLVSAGQVPLFRLVLLAGCGFEAPRVRPVQREVAAPPAPRRCPGIPATLSSACRARGRTPPGSSPATCASSGPSARTPGPPRRRRSSASTCRPPARPRGAAVFLLVFLDPDDGGDAATARPGAVGCGGIRLIGHRPAGPGARPSLAAAGDADLLQQRDELRAVAVLARGEDPGDRAAPAVSGQVDLGAQPPDNRGVGREMRIVCLRQAARERRPPPGEARCPQGDRHSPADRATVYRTSSAPRRCAGSAARTVATGSTG